MLKLTTDDDVYLHWNKADVGELSSLDLFRKLGFEGGLSKIEKVYLDTVEINESFCEIAPIGLNNSFIIW